MSNQAFEFKEDEHISDLRVVTYETSMSWSTTKIGTCTFRSQLHKRAGWVSVSLAENPEKGPSKLTIGQLDPAAARALYLQLHSVYGKKD